MKETEDSTHIYQNVLDKTCFKQGMAYRYFKDLTRKTVSNKMLRHKSFKYCYCTINFSLMPKI